MSKSLKILIVGCGSIARIHARIIQDNFNEYQIFCYDINSAAQSEFINQFNAKKFDKNKYYDALVVCTPTNKHLQTLKKFKDYTDYYFIEKPIANTLEEMDQVLDLVTTNNLYCGLIETHNYIFKELKNLLNNEKIISIQISRHSPEISKERVTSDAHLDLAIHDISVLLKHFINFNDILKVDIIKAYKNKDYFETSDILVKSSKINVNISVSRKTHKKIRTWRVVTNLKTYEIDLIANTINIYELNDPIVINSNQFTQKILETHNKYSLIEPAEMQMKDFINGVLNKGFSKENFQLIKQSHTILLNS